MYENLTMNMKKSTGFEDSSMIGIKSEQEDKSENFDQYKS